MTADADADAGSAADAAPRGGFAAELRDAISVRAFALILGGLLLQLGFIASYLGAFHSPHPHRIPVAVVAPGQVSDQLVAKVRALPKHPVKPRTAPDEATARRWILDREVDAAYVVNPAGGVDRLLVASAGGPAVSQTATQIAQALAGTQHRQVTVTDIRPASPGDGRGLSSFYLVVGWVVGGYLTASILGVAGGSRPANIHRTVIRLGALALYAIVSGLAGALIAGPLFGALSGHFLALAAIGALVVAAAAAATVALQILFGIVGIGLAILLFVVLGNPSAGGPYPAPLLPAFWRVIGPLLPPGAGVTAVRNTVYFSGHAIGGALLVLACYAAAGTLVSLAASAWYDRH
jgi:hypothetical protein